MPWPHPTLTALRAQAIEDITTSGIPRLDGLLRNAVLRVLAWTMAGLAYSEYGYLDWIAREGVPFTATDEYLEAWAALIGIYRKDSTPASGTALFTGVPGKVIPFEAALHRQDGTPYTTVDEATVDASGNVSVLFVAAVNGAATDCEDGTPMSIDDPIAGINSGGVTVGPASGGSDQETDGQLRNRMLAKYRAPPQGGSVADYQQWALEVPGCTRAWVSGQTYGPGSVVVYPMFDDVQSANGGFPVGSDGVASDEVLGTPATGDQLLVANHIYPLQPVTVLTFVVSPIAFSINVTLTNLVPDTQEIRDEIVLACEDMYLVTAEIGGVIYPSQLYEAILAVPGLDHFVMTGPSVPLQAPTGALPVMGTLTVS